MLFIKYAIIFLHICILIDWKGQQINFTLFVLQACKHKQIK